jgi:hypothetical protein
MCNNPNIWTKKITHIYITRTGECKTVTNFSEGLRATKFELNILGTISRGLYIHIELVQPRVYPPGNEDNAQLAPTPDFTDIQYQKLALLYTEVKKVFGFIYLLTFILFILVS